MSNTSRRIFFALWPPESVRLQLSEQTRPYLPLHTRAVKAANLHMTLAFIGAVDVITLGIYEQVASSLHASPFKITLDKSGCFVHAQVLWLGCSRVNSALSSLVSSLNKSLVVGGYHASDKPFIPHVTLARRYKSPQAVDIPVSIDWWVQDFALVESRLSPDGVRYKVLQTWPLHSG